MQVAFCGSLNDAYSLSVFQGAKDWIREHPDSQLLAWSGNHSVPLKALPYLQPDAVVYGLSSAGETSGEHRKTPKAAFFRRPEPIDFPLFVNDDLQVGRLAAETLLQAGYDRMIVFVAESMPSRLRMQGFGEVMERVGVPVEFISSEVPRPGPGKTFSDALKSHHDSVRSAIRAIPVNSGIFCPLSAQVPDLMLLLETEIPLRVPEDYGLIVGDLPPLSSADAGLAHVILNGEEIGRQMFTVLSEAVTNGSLPAAVVREIPPLGVERGRTLRLSEGTVLLQAMDAYCKPRLDKVIIVEDVARALGLSRRVLELKLHRLGLPAPFEYLTQLRLRLAEQRLRESNDSIERIAEACGFAEMRSFSRWFRRHHGYSASSFRARCR